jgi:hypothetical protein
VGAGKQGREQKHQRSTGAGERSSVHVNVDLSAARQGAHDNRQTSSFHAGRSKPCARARANACASALATQKERRTTNRHAHTPGRTQCIVIGRSSGLPSSFPGPAFPCTGHSGVRRGSSGIQQRGLRRTGVRWIRTRHRLPVSPSCRRAGRHHSLDWARFYSPGAPLSPHSLASREALINSWRRTWHGK